MIKRLKLKNLDSIELFNTDLSHHEYPTHYHETFCITLIKNGTFCENEIIAPSGTILISHPFEVHENKVFQDNLYSHTTFYVNSDVVKFANKSKSAFFEDKVIYDNSLFAAFKKLSKKTFEDIDSKVFEDQLFGNLSFLINKHSEDKPFIISKEDSLIDEAKRHILKNLDTKISLEDLAQNFGMSKFKFIRWFKQNIGLTPFDYIILNRIESGKEMINQGKPLLETALDTGFYDQSHFSNYFKRFVGVTPKTYQTGCNIFQDN